MSDTITVTGIVASMPKALTTTEGLAITSFRLASNQRKFDRAQDKWVDGDTNWYTVTTFRQLAANAAISVNKGDRVLVTGRLRVRDWQAGEKSGTNVDVEADALGHDLSWGTANFSRGGGAAMADAAAGVSASASADASARASASQVPQVQAAGFPTEAELAAIVDGTPAPAAEASVENLSDTPF